MTRHPEPLWDGKNAPRYFISRLTYNNPYNNNGLGDRVLAVFLGEDSYYFYTYDENTKNLNVNKPITFMDIESEWTYVYYSYSHKMRKVIGFVYKGNDIQRVIFDVMHNVPKQLRFILGGNDVITIQYFSLKA